MGEEDDVSRFGFGGTSGILILVPQILRSNRDQDLGRPREECYQEMLRLARPGQGMDRRAGNLSGIPVKPLLTWMPQSAGPTWHLFALPALPATVAEAAVLDGHRGVCRGVGDGGGGGASGGAGCWCWALVLVDAKGWCEAQEGHRMGESRYCSWRARCSDCTECMELLDLDEKVPPPARNRHCGFYCHNALHRGGRIDRALDAFTGRHQTTQPFPLGTDFWE
jgi:hypothetical protein